MKAIPLCPIPIKKAERASRGLLWFGERAEKAFPRLELNLKQAELGLSPKAYLAICAFSALFFTTIVFAVLLVAGSMFAIPLIKSAAMGLSFGCLLGVMTFAYQTTWPKLAAARRVGQIDKYLIFALKDILIHIRSGVPIFDSLATAAHSGYGLLSKEFEHAIRRINAGIPTEDALEQLALENPSHHFRRSIWQLANGMKAGSDVGSVLATVIDNLAAEQKIQIRRYGARLNPLALMYMMVAVVMPALGITIAFILSSFPSIAISAWMFWFLLGIVALMQFMLLGMIKTRRPNLIS